MHTITKVPTPRGYKALDAEIPVKKILGISEAYKEDGILKGKISDVPQDKYVYLKVTYKINYNDGTTKEFSYTEQLYNDNTINLNAVPFFMEKNRRVESIEIMVEDVTGMEGKDENIDL